MAKRRRHKRVHGTHRRRRRMGAVTGMGKMLVDTGAVVAGAAAGAFVNSTLKSAFTTMPLFVPAAATLVAGVVVEKMAKGNDAIANVGVGMAAAGGLFLLNETFLSLPGISGFVTNYNVTAKNKPALQQRVGAPGFMDRAIGSARDLTPIAGVSARVMGILDN